MPPTPTVRERFPREIVELENRLIPMRDGCRLAARIWLPADADAAPVPAILEHLPYRKRDGTVARDCLTHPWLAGHGYACIRTDLRGSGDSEGLMDDEYTARELDDACDVIAWAAAQPWCGGTVGMTGISWGGFNALQVAARRPPALRAIVTLCSSADRFATDIHYKGGCLLGENAGWAATMLSYSSRPPDPLLFGDGWREAWLERLERMPFLATRWASHQRRDAYWRHGSVCEDYGAIGAAVLAIGGWHDGYRDTVAELVANLTAPVKGIVGPWNHKYPHVAAPAPRIGFLQESLRWWERWLKGIDTGVERDPAYRAYLMDSVRPERRLDERPGRWIVEREWPSTSIVMRVFALDARRRLVGAGRASASDAARDVATDRAAGGALDDAPDEAIASSDGAGVDLPATSPLNIAIRSPCDCGAATGEFFPFNYGPELPDDQRRDDARSVCFDGAPLERAHDIVGAPALVVRCRADRPLAQLVVRLCDLRPDGTSALITLGALNLAHRRSREQPEPLVPGEPVDVTVGLDQTAYRIPAGHRLRVALSSVYWPLLWPTPERATVTLDAARLRLPVRERSASADDRVAGSGSRNGAAMGEAAMDDAAMEGSESRDVRAGDEWTFPPAEGAAPWRHENLRPATSARRTETDPASGVVTTLIDDDFGENRDLEHGLTTGSRVAERWSIHPDDPLSARATFRREQTLERDGWRVRTVAELDVRCDAERLLFRGRLVAWENDGQVFERDYAEEVGRELV